jgi:DNA-directed RNA polymerase specialized sigma24 family protein
LWNRYFQSMVVVARRRLNGNVTLVDEEDVALSAFDLIANALRRGRYPDVGDREAFWRMLALSTARKASDHIKMEGAAKRGGGRAAEAGASRMSRQMIDLDHLPSDSMDPFLLATMSDECLRLLRLLDDDELATVAQWKLEGYNNDEIAERLGYSRRTVQRMTKLIRRIWSREVEEDGG